MEENEYSEAWDQPELTPEERAAAAEAAAAVDQNEKEPATEPPLVKAVEATQEALSEEDEFANAYRHDSAI